MMKFLRKHKHLYATLTPILFGLIFLAAILPSVNGPITFHEADALTNIFHSNSWGLRMVAPILMCLIMLVAFHMVKVIRGLKIATIGGALTVLVFTGGVYLKNVPTAREQALPNIIVDVAQFDPEPQTIYFDVPEFNAVKFYSTEKYPVAEYSAKPTGEHHFWLVLPLEFAGETVAEELEAINIPAGYYIKNQLGNEYYTAVDLTLTTDKE